MEISNIMDGHLTDSKIHGQLHALHAPHSQLHLVCCSLQQQVCNYKCTPTLFDFVFVLKKVLWREQI